MGTLNEINKQEILKVFSNLGEEEMLEILKLVPTKTILSELSYRVEFAENQINNLKNILSDTRL